MWLLNKMDIPKSRNQGYATFEQWTFKRVLSWNRIRTPLFTCLCYCFFFLLFMHAIKFVAVRVVCNWFSLLQKWKWLMPLPDYHIVTIVIYGCSSRFGWCFGDLSNHRSVRLLYSKNFSNNCGINLSTSLFLQQPLNNDEQISFFWNVSVCCFQILPNFNWTYFMADLGLGIIYYLSSPEQNFRN